LISAIPILSVVKKDGLRSWRTMVNKIRRRTRKMMSMMMKGTGIVSMMPSRREARMEMRMLRSMNS
jgi:hypothetical protein